MTRLSEKYVQMRSSKVIKLAVRYVASSRTNVSIFFASIVITGVFLYPTSISLFNSASVLDSSWRWALFYGWSHHLNYGTQFLFTYGPLGFLDSVQFGDGYGVVVLQTILFVLADSWLVVLCFRLWRTVSGLTRLQRTIFGASLGVSCVLITGSRSLSTVLAFVMALILTSELVEVRAEGLKAQKNRSLFQIAVLGSIIWQLKTSFLLLVIFMFAVFVINSVITKRSQFLSYASFLIVYFLAFSLLVLLLFYGSIPNLYRVAVGVVQIVQGYGDAMVISGYPFQVAVGFGFSVALVILYLFVLIRRGADVVYRAKFGLGLVLMVGFTFFWWKEGVVRQDISIQIT